MLGIGVHAAGWRWHAAGKHPAAADYIRLMEGAPLAEALSEWVRKGYEQWQAARPDPHEPCSWRFWLRGGQKGHLICGVVRDSSDRIGRPFPLMVVGAGPLSEWERRWPRLPRLLEKTWSQMERLAVQRFEDLKALNEALLRLTPPGEPEGSPGEGQPAQTPEGDHWHAFRKELVQTGRAVLALDAPPGADAEQDALSWHAGLQSCYGDIPRAVFMGGSPRRIYLAAMLKPLTTADFVTLWNIA